MTQIKIENLLEWRGRIIADNMAIETLLERVTNGSDDDVSLSEKLGKNRVVIDGIDHEIELTEAAIDRTRESVCP